MARGGALIPSVGPALPGGGPAIRAGSGGETSPPRTGLLVALAAAVAAVIYGPMLLPGYPLRYDLVSVPRPVLGADALGLGDRLPRAVPLDAAVAVLARVVPSSLVTQLLALLALILAGWGVAVLTPAPLPGRLLALLVAEWNPFVFEQLAIGHVPHLFAYGALPWAAIFGRSLTRAGPDSGSALRPWAGLTAAVGFGSLTPGGGVLCAIAALAGLVVGARAARGPDAVGGGRRAVAGLASVAVLQLPWLIASAAAPGFAASSDAADSGVTAFALRSETGWGRLVDAAGLAGMWNHAALLGSSRDTVLARVSTVLLLALAAAGLPAVRRCWRAGWAPEVLAAAAAAASGYLVAVLPVLPGGRRLLEAAITALPGAGLLRDGHRWLALPAVVIAVLCGLGVSELANRLPGPTRAPQRVAVAVFVAFLVVASMPDLAGGLAGRLRAWHYPPQWAQARAVLEGSNDQARVLVLPWQPFRKFSWSGNDPVLDPAPRLLPRQTIVSDALTVSGRLLPPEGPGARAVTTDLNDNALSDTELRSVAVGWVLIERDTSGSVPTLPTGWITVLDGPQLTLLRAPNPLPSAPAAAPARTVAVIGAQLTAGLLLLFGLLVLVGTRLRRLLSAPVAGEMSADARPAGLA